MYAPDSLMQQEKVQSTLGQFVREWSDVGKTEREKCYGPLLSALEQRFPDVSKRYHISSCFLVVFHWPFCHTSPTINRVLFPSTVSVHHFCVRPVPPRPVRVCACWRRAQASADSPSRSRGAGSRAKAMNSLISCSWLQTMQWISMVHSFLVISLWCLYFSFF